MAVTICEGEGLSMSIRDNGSGFDAAAVGGPTSGHFGLSGMKRRASWLGGEIRIKSIPGEGSEILITLPRTRVSPAPPMN